MPLLSNALPSPQQPLLQVQSKSKSSQSYTLFKYHFAASSVLPSPRLINVSSCHFAACHFNRSSAEPLHRRWHAPPRRLPRLSFACCRSGVLLHLVRAVSLLLTQWGLAFVRHGSTSTDDDDIITMMMSSRRCRRLPHATPPFPEEDKASHWFASRLRMMSFPPSVFLQTVTALFP